MLPDLIRIDHILPNDVCRWSNARQRMQERLRHPHRQYRIFLSERLPACRRVAIACADEAAECKLCYADNQRRRCKPNLGSAVFGAAVDNERSRSTDYDDKRNEPQIERYVAVLGYPSTDGWQTESA